MGGEEDVCLEGEEGRENDRGRGEESELMGRGCEKDNKVWVVLVGFKERDKEGKLVKERRRRGRW